MQQTEERGETSREQGEALTLLLPATKALWGIVAAAVILALAGTFVSVRGTVGVISLVIGLLVLIPIFLAAAYVVALRPVAVVEIRWVDRYRCPACGAFGIKNEGVSAFLQQYGDRMLTAMWECPNRHTFFVNRFGFPHLPKQTQP